MLLPANGDVSGPIAYPSLVRNTLGLQNSQWTGRGIGVAVVDSGLEMSSEFRYRVTGFYDFTKGGVDAVPAYDDYGHGTHVASLIGGSGALSYNSANKGLAPNVRFIILKALDKNGAGYTSDVIRAIDFAVDKRAALGIHIINLSLGHPIAQPAAMDPLVQAVERATRAGLIVVVAAGNMGIHPETGKPGYAGITSPGNAPSAITVGAVKTLDTVSRNDDRIPDYSSSGPTWYDAMVKPDLLAPGHNLVAAAAKQGSIYSAYPKLRDADSDYIRLSGTSMATAVASGAIAQMLEAQQVAGSYDGPLTPNAVKAALQYTALGIRNDQGVQYDRLRKGAGSLNGKGAIDVAMRFDASASGRPWLTSMSSPWTDHWRGVPDLEPGRDLGQRRDLGQHARVGRVAAVGDERHLGERRDLGQHAAGGRAKSVGQQRHLGQHARVGRLGDLGQQRHLGQQLHRLHQRERRDLGQHERPDPVDNRLGGRIRNERGRAIETGQDRAVNVATTSLAGRGRSAGRWTYKEEVQRPG